MHQLLKTLLFFLFSVTTAIAQDCLHFTFTTQSSIDSFPINNPSCGDFVGNLIIDGPDIVSLDSLQQIKACASLHIKNTSLTDLCGLENLELAYVGDPLIFDIPAGIYIENNVELKSLNGIQGLKKTSNVSIINNPRLRNLDGMFIEDFTFYDDPHIIGVIISIIGNDSLQTINNFENLEHCGFLYIEDNPMLEDMSSLDNLRLVWNRLGLETYEGDLKIRNNPMLSDLPEIDKISVTGCFVLDNCSAIEDLSNLNELVVPRVIITNNLNLQSIGINTLDVYEGFEYSNNPKLESIAIADFKAPSYFTADLKIINNPILNICHEDYVCQLLDTLSIDPAYGEFTIRNNGIGCFDNIIVAQECFDDVIGGYVYFDENCDQSFDSLEIGIPDLAIYEESNLDSALTFSYSNGGYIFRRPIGTTFEHVVESIDGFSFSPVSHVTAQGQIGLDFGACVEDEFLNLIIDLTPIGISRPGFSNSYQLCINNKGTTLESGEIILDLVNADELLPYLSYISTDSATETDLDLSWSFTSLGPFESQCYEVIAQYDADTPLGTKINYQATVTSTSALTDVDPEDNMADLCQVVVGSYDPNDKLVSPDTIDYEDRFDPHTFEYLIRFQNEGTAAADFVIVYDTIQSFMDRSSFDMISASHDYEMVFVAANVIQWKFLNINLPPKSEDPIKSNGFIKFRINNFPDQEYPEPIRNRASIYFEYNDPITTEYATVHFRNSPKDLAVNINSKFIDCSQIEYNIQLMNKVSLLSEETQLKFSFDKLSGSDTYSYAFTDNATIVNDTLVWDVPSLASFDTINYIVRVDVNNGYFNAFKTMSCTSLIASEDDDLNDNRSTYSNADLLSINTSLRLTSQQQVDNSYCLIELANLFIGEDSTSDRILNVDSLKYLTRVDSSLTISACEKLEVLNGFESLAYVKDLSIRDNDDLISISGFESMEELYTLSIILNKDLQILNGFENLKVLSEEFSFTSNVDITSLLSFDPPLTVYPPTLRIQFNLDLSVCNSNFICAALDASTFATINSNEVGCDAIPEVHSACPTVSTGNLEVLKNFKIYPNPVTDEINIKFLGENLETLIQLSQTEGRVLMQRNISEAKHYTIDLSQYNPGIYFLTVSNRNGKGTKKIVIH